MHHGQFRYQRNNNGCTCDVALYKLISSNLFFQRESSPTLSMREKTLLKRRINKEHNSNFRAGYVQIHEDHLHKTGIRGRKQYVVYAFMIIVFVLAVLNLLVSTIYYPTVRISMQIQDSESYGLSWLYLFSIPCLQITITIIGVLKIDMGGMQGLEFVPSGRLLRFLDDGYFNTIHLQENKIHSLPYQELEISGSRDHTVRILA